MATAMSCTSASSPLASEHDAADLAAFSVDVAVAEGCCELTVKGDVDVETALGLSAAGERGLALQGVREIVVDLRGVTFMDSTGLGALVAIRNAAVERLVAFGLRDIPAPVAKLLHIVGLEQILG
jgi:anti-anti-sigma factor